MRLKCGCTLWEPFLYAKCGRKEFNPIPAVLLVACVLALLGLAYLNRAAG